MDSLPIHSRPPQLMYACREACGVDGRNGGRKQWEEEWARSVELVGLTCHAKRNVWAIARLAHLHLAPAPAPRPLPAGPTRTTLHHTTPGGHHLPSLALSILQCQGAVQQVQVSFWAALSPLFVGPEVVLSRCCILCPTKSPACSKPCCCASGLQLYALTPRTAQPFCLLGGILAHCDDVGPTPIVLQGPGF